MRDWARDRTREDAVAALTAAEIPAAPVRTYAEAARDPHVAERDMLQPTELEDGSRVPVTGPAVFE